MSLVIAAETPLQDDVRELVAALNETAFLLTPPEHCHHMTVEQMAQPDTTLFVARENWRAIAMGALRRHPGAVGEVKRMFTIPAYRGHGVGTAIVERVEAQARSEALLRLVLETGTNFDAARRMYTRLGFLPVGPVLGYAASPWNVFYEKVLFPDPASHASSS